MAMYLVNLDSALKGTHIANYEATDGSSTTFKYGNGASTYSFNNNNGGADINFGHVQNDCGAKIQTPGANLNQAGDVYNQFAKGDAQAATAGKQGAFDASCGLFADAAGLFNAHHGVNHNLILLL